MNIHDKKEVESVTLQGRLRQMASIAITHPLFTDYVNNALEAALEAADEIERLTALRKEDREDMQRLSDQVDYLSDENAKLQAAWAMGRQLESTKEGLDFKYKTLDEAIAALKGADDE